MSAFVVTVAWDGCPARDLDIERAIPVLLPAADGHEVWRGAGIAVARSAFRVCPEDQCSEVADQHQLDRIVCVADARLDNRDELVSELRGILRSGLPTDTALILAAFERWGEGLVDQLHGDFAFVIWNTRERSLFGASDPLGGRHLRYSKWGARLTVGSRTTPVAMVVPDGETLNEDFLREFQAAESSRWLQETCFRHVRRVPPGHVLRLQDGNVEIRQYWQAGQTPKERFSCEADYVARFRELFERSVRTRIRSRSPIAFSLSGGLDSSSVTAMAHAVWPSEGPPTGTVYSSLFCEAPLADERGFSEAVMGECPKFSWRPIVADDHLPFDCERDYTPYHLDEPELALPSGVMHAMIRRAADDGHRVMLGGHLADQLLGDLYWDWRALAALPLALWPRELKYFLAKKRPFARLARAVAVAGAGRMLASGPPAGLLAAASRARMLGARMLRLRAMFGNLGDNVGMELRFPFGDRKLVEFSWNLPPELLFQAGYSKRILRLAAAPVLPEVVRLRRGNAVFGEHAARGLRRNISPLRDLAKRAEVVRMGWTSPAQLGQLLDDAAAGPRLGIVGFRAVSKWVGMEAFLRYRFSGRLTPLGVRANLGAPCYNSRI